MLPQTACVCDGRPSQAVYQDCKAPKNQLRSQASFWDTESSPGAVGDKRKILI